MDLPWLDDVVRAKRPQRLPIVLAREEVRAALQPLEGVPRLMAHLLYGAGLRLLECCRLRVQQGRQRHTDLHARAQPGPAGVRSPADRLFNA